MTELRQDVPPGDGRARDVRQPATRQWPRWRVLLIRVWAGLLTLLMLAMARGVVWLTSAAPDEQYMYATSTVWKLLSLGGAAWVLWTGGRSVLAYWLIALGQLTWLLAGLLNPQPDGNGLLLSLVNLVIFYGPLVALRPERRRLLHPGLHPSALLLVVSLVGATPLAVFASRVADRYSGFELGFDMTGLYLALAAFAVFAALRPEGGRLLPYLVSASAACTGLAAVLLPEDDASPGRVGGSLLLAWAVALAAGARSCGPGHAPRDSRTHRRAGRAGAAVRQRPCDAVTLPLAPPPRSRHDPAVEGAGRGGCPARWSGRSQA